MPWVSSVSPKCVQGDGEIQLQTVIPENAQKNCLFSFVTVEAKAEVSCAGTVP
jgi:hypothetical protein